MSKFGFYNNQLCATVVVVSPWIKKQSSRGYASEHLESPGTKFFMNGPIVHKLCVGGKKQTKKTTSKQGSWMMHVNKDYRAASLLT